MQKNNQFLSDLISDENSDGENGSESSKSKYVQNVAIKNAVRY
jgi:hypothetical protein